MCYGAYVKLFHDYVDCDCDAFMINYEMNYGWNFVKGLEWLDWFSLLTTNHWDENLIFFSVIINHSR